MNNYSVYTGIDIGSKNLKIMSIEFDPETNKTKILHKNSYLSRGVSDGYISNPDLFHQSFSEALKKYKKETEIKIDEAIFTIDSFGLKSKTLKINHNTVNQSNITEVDINEIERKINLFAEKNIQGKILDSKLIKYKINNYDYFSDIEGLQSKKVEAEYIFIYLPNNHLTTLEKILMKNDISMIDLLSGNIISSEINLEKDDKNLGVLNIDIGADTTSLSIWENNKLIFLDSISYGSDDITKKISLENKVPFSEAESLKKNSQTNKKIEKIIKTSFKDLAKKIKTILIDLKKDQLLPAGAIIYGGGAKSEITREVLKNELSIPIKKYLRNISDSSTDYHNIYAGLISHILNEKDRSFFKLPSIRKNLGKLFSKFSLK